MVNLIPDIKQRCLRCGKTALITDTDTGEIFCAGCGFVLSDHIENPGPERRSFPDDRINRERTGSGTSLAIHDKGLSTIISPTNKDATGKPLSNSMKMTLNRLRKWDNRSQVHEPIDRNFRRAFSELHRLKDKLSLSDSVLEQAAYIYRKAQDKKLIRGRSISAMIGSALYAACREAETPRTLKEIAVTMNIKKWDLAARYRLLVKELDLKIPVVDSVQNVAKIASKIGLSEKTKRYAIEILRKAEENKISSGKNPMGLAAAALYAACVSTGENKTQRDLSEAASITEVTIRNRYKGLKELYYKKNRYDE